MLALSKEHIEATPGICGGKPRVAGHRIRVMDVAVAHQQGRSPTEIQGSYPSLSLADVHAALAYYFDHREPIDQDIRAEREHAELLSSRHSGPLAAKLDRQPGD